ncbi:MAG: 7-beta-(4-carbaxybutanamido)cephalosporanic acid acylase [Candidatus Fraserbacteria bacterium RBG_16_55_9]|uniref:7-beta-(4-carbaxybutanamido)cephalosporanic acid acylase n=1 Tax=Fraserbacteria sp. (strain RBG_16_55_9) TaxID=1817864 RepID=A0A1F5URT7_FRAXR|nr:MAG: 7-beta-(4-carbaxybutanamido)cephalosporanic acid acylase [Candidatus Fraserbacteria bacterium RBG_16_55_9]
MKNLLLGELEFKRAPEAEKVSSKPTEILWDTWGVPHIFAKDSKGLFYAFGWAQMKSHGDVILRLYGQARGRGAEYWGEPYLESDHWTRLNGIPARAHEWYNQQSPKFRGYLAAFAQGINDYAKEHADEIADDAEVVLPVDEIDVLAHAGRIFHFFATLNGYAGGVSAQTAIKEWMGAPETISQNYEDVLAGSNAWAISPSRSEDGHAMLVANPHLPWVDFLRWYEAQLTSPDYNAYGATLVGFPGLAIAFNDYLGWTHTVNALDASDLYELTLADGGYRFDGEVRPFEIETQTLKVKQADGSLREETLVIRRSIQGAVVAERDGKALALRVIGVDQMTPLEEWWDMGRAKSLSGFRAVLSRLKIPVFTVMYADRDGHIMHFFNGRVPVRSQGDARYWSGVVPGDTSATLWTKYHSYRDLPIVIDPPSGWLENANDPPWATTLPPALNPDDYAPYLSPRLMNFRAQRLAHMLMEDDQISFEELIAGKYSTRMELADRILDDLIPAARQYGSDMGKQAADVLEAWDRQANAESRGAVLFLFWMEAMKPVDSFASNFFSTPWDEKNPINTPDGLADAQSAVAALEAAATQVQAVYGQLDIAWGDVMRLRYGDKDYPGNGGPGDPAGIVRVIYYTPAPDGYFQSVAGDSYFAAIEFSTPVRAKALLMYGNASQPGSSHAGDQLELSARKEMRPIWRTRWEIDAHLESREVLK